MRLISFQKANIFLNYKKTRFSDYNKINNKGKMLKMRKKLNIIIGVIALMGLIVSIYLIISQLVTGNTCPKFLGIPACYIVGPAYLIVILSLVIRDRSINRALFFTAAFVGIFLGAWFSIAHMTGTSICPTLLGIPLCYANAIIYLVITIIKMAKLN